MNILHLDSSVLGAYSATRELGAALVSALRERAPDAQVVYHDLAAAPLAHFSAEVLGARQDPNSASQLDDARRADIDAGNRALEEVLAADVIVLGAPMYNFSVPTQLKAWIDRIAVAGKTFRYTAQGPEGLLKGKKLVVVSARGGIYSQGAAAAMDHQESYLRAVFGLLGVTEVDYIRAEGLNLGTEQRSAALKAAHEQIVQPLAA